MRRSSRPIMLTMTSTKSTRRNSNIKGTPRPTVRWLSTLIMKNWAKRRVNRCSTKNPRLASKIAMSCKSRDRLILETDLSRLGWKCRSSKNNSTATWNTRKKCNSRLILPSIAWKRSRRMSCRLQRKIISRLRKTNIKLLLSSSSSSHSWKQSWSRYTQCKGSSRWWDQIPTWVNSWVLSSRTSSEREMKTTWYQPKWLEDPLTWWSLVEPSRSLDMRTSWSRAKRKDGMRLLKLTSILCSTRARKILVSSSNWTTWWKDFILSSI